MVTTLHRLIVGLAFVVVLTPTRPVDAAGPWKGRVLDAETGRPLEGAVVLAAWWKRGPALVHETREFYEAIEAVTDAEGRFVIPAVRTVPPNPLTRIEGPDIKIFKGGYGQWRFRGEPPMPGSPGAVWDAFRAAAWKRFERDGVVFELPPLKTERERREFRGFVRPDFDIPESLVRRYLEEIEKEDEWLGLGRRPPR